MNIGIGKPPAPELTHLCGHSRDFDAARCEAEAELHVLVRHRDAGTLHRLATCVDHYRVALAAGELVDVHEFRGWCGLPGTYWHRGMNLCELDGSGQASP